MAEADIEMHYHPRNQNPAAILGDPRVPRVQWPSKLGPSYFPTCLSGAFLKLTAAEMTSIRCTFRLSAA